MRQDPDRANLQEKEMTPFTDPAQFLTQLFQSGQDFARQFPGAGASAASKESSSASSGASGDFMAAPKQMFELQQRMLENFTAFWSTASGTATGSDDRRFADAAWREDPRFDLVRRAYLGYARFLEDSVNAAPFGEKEKGQLRFGVRQFIDAMSPANFLATNPEAAQLALETGGRSLTEGMALYLEDLAKGRVSMSDESAFTVGKNLATTPGAVVYENELIQLIQYAPATGAKQVYQQPLVMIPACINKFYVLDLQPENSVVRYAVEQGHTVFMVSWRNISAEQDKLTFDDYVKKGVLAAIDVAREVCRVDRVNMLGFCVGGTLLGSALGVLAANGEKKVESMTLLTTLLDFSDTGELGLLVSEQGVMAREATIGTGGVLRGKELGFIFSALRANDLVWQYVVNSYLKGKAPPAFDMLFWNSDGTNLPGPMFCWYLRNTYLENKLCQPGKAMLCGAPLDLGDIDVDTYLYASREDHIVPWSSAYASRQVLGGDTTFVLGASGHIAGVINPPSKNKRNYWVEGKAAGDAQAWFAAARSVPGSWWPHWNEWLVKRAGKRVAARAKLGNKKYPSIEPAPGRYVLAPAD
jgi:polyhydroxyalkanoate synthase subunit PhaC